MVAVQGAREQRIVLYNVGWDTYERLLRDHASVSAPRFTFDRGTLEIVSPLPEHERYNRAIQLLLPVLAEELGLEIYSLGSTTFSREDLQSGFEPDSCFYLRDIDRIRGGRIDLRTDPPPDLVVEIDITHPSIDKLPLYAQVGVPEVWRFDGTRFEILLRSGDRYGAATHSGIFPAVSASALAALMPVSVAGGDVAWIRRVRVWARSLVVPRRARRRTTPKVARSEADG